MDADAPASATSHERGLVDFCVIGAMKSGTTSLYDVLATHPMLHLPVKEIHWFSRHFDKRSREDYDAGFSPAPGQLCGEASTSYTMRPQFSGVPERMAAYNPDMKVIYLVRNPVDRIESHLAHRAVRVDGFQDPFDPQLLARSFYRYQIDPYLALFPAEQVLIIGFEQLRADVAGTIRVVTDFLGVPFHGVTALPHQNSTLDEVPSVRPHLRRSFAALPVSARIRLRRFVTRPRRFDADSPRPELTPATRSELWDLLIGDVLRLNEIAPNVVAPWLSDPTFPTDHVAQVASGAAHLRYTFRVATPPPTDLPDPPAPAVIPAEQPVPVLSS